MVLQTSLHYHLKVSAIFVFWDVKFPFHSVFVQKGMKFELNI